MAVDVDENDIAEVAKNIQIGEGEYGAIFDQAQQVVIHPSILCPLRLLTEGAERIKSGDSTEPIPVLSNDEIGRVSESFNEMSTSLWVLLIRLDDSISQIAASS